MAVITSRYVGGSSESQMEEDLARLRPLEKGDSAGFKAALEDAMAAELTSDFWTTTLPTRLESSSSRSAAPFFAAQCVMNTKALFSELSVSALLDPETVSTREDVEVHHLFPKAWLKKKGYGTVREYNQIANYALLEWTDNNAVSDKDPAEYVPEMEARIPNSQRGEARTAHALPNTWWEMEYTEFLQQRRVLMAEVIRQAFERMGEG
jgi:hypothetical protein